MAYPWTANDILTAADLNAAISTGIISTGLGAWTGYTPTWASSGTAVSLVNGTITGRYIKIGRYVAFTGKMTAGSSTTFGTGSYSWTTPTSMDATSGNVPSFYATIVDASPAARYMRTGILVSGTAFQFFSEAGTVVGQTSPMTWASGDTITFAGWYESAS